MTDNEMAQLVLKSIVDGSTISYSFDRYLLYRFHDDESESKAFSKDVIVIEGNTIRNQNGILKFRVNDIEKTKILCLCCLKIIYISGAAYLRGDDGRWDEWKEFNQLMEEGCTTWH